MSNGWICLHRSIQDGWIWKKYPFSYGQAWIDLLLLANYEDSKTLLNGNFIVCKRGDVNLSIANLAERWKWDRKKVRRFLKLLESDQMVTVNATTHRTTITIVNYGFYQNLGSTDGTTDGQPMVQPLPTTNNINNITNNNINSRFAPPTVEMVSQYCRERNNGIDADAFVSFYESKGWMIGKNKMKDWKAAVRTWERKRKKTNSFAPKEKSDYDFDEIEKMMGG